MAARGYNGPYSLPQLALSPAGDFNWITLFSKILPERRSPWQERSDSTFWTQGDFSLDYAAMAAHAAHWDDAEDAFTLGSFPGLDPE